MHFLLLKMRQIQESSPAEEALDASSGWGGDKPTCSTPQLLWHLDLCHFGLCLAS